MKVRSREFQLGGFEMVKAVQVNSLGFMEWLLRVRPGVAISLALHVALLLFLAIMLAFPPGDPPAPVDKEVIIDMTVPPAPPRVAPKTTPPPKFRPDLAPAMDSVKTTVKPLDLPPVQNFDRTPATVVTTTQPQPPTIEKPVPIKRGGLSYPERAADRNITGYVDFSFIIEPDGSVGDPEVTAETPEGYGFAAAALKAFKSWRFEPKRIDGNPVAAQAHYRISFKLE
jgi:protein TonB